MKLKLTFLSFLFILAGLNAQETEKESIGDLVYETYEEQGIEKALEHYDKVKAEKAEAYKWNEWELNRIGYQLMEKGDMDAAEKVFKRNMEEYPEAANPNDSYADYLLEKGDKEGAKKYFKKSVAIAEKSDNEDERNRILKGSKAKLAKLENKHKSLSFLIGDWEIQQTGYNEGEEITMPASSQSIKYLPGENVIRVVHTDAFNDPCCERYVGYDAMEDHYEMAFVNSKEPTGIELSNMTVKNLDDNTYEMIENYTDNDGMEKQARHEIKRNGDDNLEWNVFIPGEQDENWQLVNNMKLKRKA